MNDKLGSWCSACSLEINEVLVGTEDEDDRERGQQGFCLCHGCSLIEGLPPACTVCGEPIDVELGEGHAHPVLSVLLCDEHSAEVAAADQPLIDQGEICTWCCDGGSLFCCRFFTSESVKSYTMLTQLLLPHLC